MTGAPGAGREAYRRAGVDVAAAERAVGLIREVASGATRPEIVEGVGGFAGLFDIGGGRLLAAATDGVGTKLEVARRVGRLDTIGIDLVAMSANDVACTGAEPLFFLDYVSVSRLDPEEVQAVVAGVAEGCRRAGCALLGGETAEHPAAAREMDLAGFCVGVVGRDRLLGPDRVRPGDVLVGLASSGLHANGFSLVRRALGPGRPLDQVVPELGRTLGEELLEPTAVYARAVRAVADSELAVAAAHVTGGGFHGNLPRALPRGLGARVDRSAWTPPPIFGLVAGAAAVPEEDLFGVLNMGIGMVLVVRRELVGDAIEVCGAHGHPGTPIGEVAEGDGVSLHGPPGA